MNFALSIAVATLVVGSLAAAGAQQTPSAPQGGTGTAPRLPVSATDIFRMYDEALDAVVEKVLPGVVRIEVSAFGRSESVKDGRDAEVISRQRVLGSGVVVDPDGYIMTNAHVVVGAQRIRVTIAPTLMETSTEDTSPLRQERVYEAKLLGLDRSVDLALVKIEEKNLAFIPLREQYSVRLGQIVLAIGSPVGLDHTVTRGIVSAVSRQVDLDQPMVHVQTDAPINPGSSGGALIDRNGNLIGINTFTISEGTGSEGLGFAIPEPVVRFAYQEFKEHGHLRRPTIKAHAQAITTDLAAGLKLPRDSGVVISDVVVGGPANKAGIEPGDVVAKLDSQEIDSLPRFSAALLLHNPDRPIEVEVLRGREVMKRSIIAVEASKRIDSMAKGIDSMAEGIDSMADLVDPQNNLVSALGVFVLELTDKTAEGLPDLRSEKGLIVAAKVDYALFSAVVVLWRFRASAAREEVERRAARVAGALLFTLTAFVAITSVTSLLGYSEPKPTFLGIAVLVAAATIMPWLAKEKRRLSGATGSAALRADAAQSVLCAYFSLIALAGLAINAIWHVKWADPIAALVVVPFILWEGREALRGRACGCC